MSHIIIGLVGELASGKGTASTYLKETYGASTHRFSTMMRDVADRLSISQTRENLQTISKLFRDAFGGDVFSHALVKEVMGDSSPIIVIDGIRRPEDVTHLKTLPGFLLVSITADMDTRYNRLILRGENEDDTSKTKEQFVEDTKREAEQKILEIAQAATHIVNNNGSRESLYTQLDDIITKYAPQSKKNA